MGFADSTAEGILKRDRTVVIVALTAIVGASWAWLLNGAGTGVSALEMSSLSMALGTGHGAAMEIADPMAAMATPAGWSVRYAALMFFMWWIMMIAMMLPSAAPTVLLYGVVNRKADETGRRTGRWSTAAFAGGYLIAWAAFSAAAAALQWSFETAGLLSPMMLNSTGAAFAGCILIGAGLYQLTPLKEACLEHCRGPITFLTHHWRPGLAGALRMGLHHGAFCLGCCWGLMALLFFGGVMNLYWIIGLAVVVALEKLAPLGRGLVRLLGALFIAWGGWFLWIAATA